MRFGTIAAVCISAEGNVPKYPQTEVVVGEYGFIGDIHAGPTRISRRTGQPKFNDRQVSFVAQEVLDTLNEKLGILLRPGDLGENVTTQGLGDLSNLMPGTRIIAGDALFEVTEQNDPCKNLMRYHRLLVKESYGRRGILAIVVQGTDIPLRPGDGIAICGTT